MDISGIYNIKIKTPFGDKEAKLELKVKENNLIGKLFTEKGDVEVNDGVVEGAKFTFSTTVQGPIGKMSVKISGEVIGDNLTAEAKLSLGTMQITGTRQWLKNCLIVLRVCF